MKKSFCCTIKQTKCYFKNPSHQLENSNPSQSLNTNDIQNLTMLELFLRHTTFQLNQNSWNVRNKFSKKVLKSSTNTNFWAPSLTIAQHTCWKVLRKGWTKNHSTQNRTGKLFGGPISSVKFNTFWRKSIDSSSLKKRPMNQMILRRSLSSLTFFSTPLWDKRSLERELTVM